MTVSGNCVSLSLPGEGESGNVQQCCHCLSRQNGFNVRIHCRLPKVKDDERYTLKSFTICFKTQSYLQLLDLILAKVISNFYVAKHSNKKFYHYLYCFSLKTQMPLTSLSVLRVSALSFRNIHFLLNVIPPLSYSTVSSTLGIPFSCPTPIKCQSAPSGLTHFPQVTCSWVRCAGLMSIYFTLSQHFLHLCVFPN